MAHVLITGGAGFIGSHTADALIKKGHKVRILDILDPQVHGESPIFPAYLSSQVQCLQGDVRRPSDIAHALEGIDIVYHFACLTGVGQSMYDLASYMDTNVTGTATLLEAIVKQTFPIKKVILSSSRAVYGEGMHACTACGPVHPGMRAREDLEKGKFDLYCPQCASALTPYDTAETCSLEPISIYGLTKKYQEDLVLHVSRAYHIPSVILRYFNVYGSRQSLSNPYTGIVSIFYSRLCSGQPIDIYELGKPKRDFVHIQDVVQANLLAIESEIASGAVCNVGSGNAITVQEMAEVLKYATKSHSAIHKTTQFRYGDIHACYANLTHTRNILGYQPCVGLTQGIEEFISWARGEKSVDLYDSALGNLRKYGLSGASSSDPT